MFVEGKSYKDIGEHFGVGGDAIMNQVLKHRIHKIPVTKRCVFCSNTYTTTILKSKRIKYCSLTCKIKARQQRKPQREDKSYADYLNEQVVEKVSLEEMIRRKIERQGLGDTRPKVIE